MASERYSWKTFDRLDVFAQVWKPAGAPRGAVALVHGLGEHIGRYTHVAERFAGAGYAFNAFDHRGHGRSGGPRLYAPSYEHLMRDIDRHLEETRARFPGIPIILYGHSVGGSLVLYYTLSRKPQLAGVIASSPALGSGTPQPQAKILFGRIMNHLIPTLIVPTGIPLSGMSRDPAVGQGAKDDPLFKEGFSVRLALEILRASEEIRGNASFPLPLLVMQGTADCFADPAMSISFAKGLSGDVTLKTWEGMYHELHNETEKDMVLAFMIDWVEKHTQGGRR
jgi:acylglycerol lipase